MWPRAARREGALVRRAILVYKLPLSVNHQRLQVIVWVAAFITRRSVSDFEVDNFFLRFVDQPMAIAGASLESSTHVRRQSHLTFVSVKRGVPSHDVNELVLLGMRVTQRRRRFRRKPGEIHTEIGEAKQITQWLLSPACHSGRERLRIIGRRVRDGVSFATTATGYLGFAMRASRPRNQAGHPRNTPTEIPAGVISRLVHHHVDVLTSSSVRSRSLPV